MNNDEIDENNWRDKKSEWLPYVKNDVLLTHTLDIINVWKK